MKGEKYLQSVASFLIVLVLTLPFYTTSVYATIGKVTVKGGDGIEGYAKSTDFLNINVQASIIGDTITNEQVVLGSGTQFDKCSPSINNGSECTLRFPGNGTEVFEAKSVPFTVNLFKDDKTLDDSKSGSVTVDSKAPQVKLSSQSKFSSQQNVVVDYDVTDFACDDSSCNNKCVGIKNIELYTKDGAFKQTIAPTTSNCNVKSSISIDPKTFNDGKNSVFAKATDKFDQVSSETSVTFTVDSTAPSIIADSFQILRKGISISTFSPFGVDVDVVVNISGSDLVLNSVTADLSALSPSKNLKNAKASCIPVSDDVSTCKWSIELNPGTGGLKTITINTIDTSGNRENTTISKFLFLDDKGPVVESLSTAATKEGQPIVKATGNTVIATFEEATGLSPEDVFLDVDGTKIKATSCRKETKWACVWDNVNFGSAAQVSVDKGSLDILGIDAEGDISLSVIVDKNAPVLRTINITPIGGIVPAFPGFAKIGDKISVVANLTEDNDVFAVADFSAFISGASNVAGSCERIQADEHICTWITDTINLEASDTIKFNFSDNAGNTLIVTRLFKTFGLESAVVPDFWSNIVACSPSTIDRELGPLINQRVFCQVKLNQKSTTKAVSTVSIGSATCSGTGSSLVQNVETLNTEVGSTSPIIKITLKRDDFKVNNAELSCSFNIFSKIGSSTTITKNPEIENAKVTLEFFNNPLGELGKEVQDKIDEAKEDAEGILEIIGTLNKFIQYSKKICQMINTIFNVISILYFVWIAVKGTEGACEGSFANLFGLCAKIYNQAALQCKTVEGGATKADFIKTAHDKFCGFVNCQITFLWGPTVQEFVNNNIPFSQYLGAKTTTKDEGFGFGSVQPVDPQKLGLKPITSYMNPQNNLLVATLFGCLPGIVHGLDKYRQIKCLYADCLQNAVGKEGLPVTACEDQKAYATCKYITGEIFALIPYTAMFDHFMGAIKNTLSNPFAILGVAASVACGPACSVPAIGGGQAAYHTCRGLRLLNLVGNTAQNVKNIIDEGFQIRQDYCERIEDNDDNKDKKVTQPTTAAKK